MNVVMAGPKGPTLVRHREGDSAVLAVAKVREQLKPGGRPIESHRNIEGTYRAVTLLIPLATPLTILPAQRGMGARPAASAHRAGFVCQQSVARDPRSHHCDVCRALVGGVVKLALRYRAPRARGVG